MAVFNIEGYNSYSGCDITVTASLPIINGEAVGKYYTLGSIQTLSISTHQDKRPVRSLGVINAKDYVMGPRTIAGSMVFAVFNKHFATEIMNDLGATQQSVVLPDEIPALDITISFANEYGRMSRMAIYGVKIINEGQVMSINDLYTENTYQFVALGLEPLSAEEPRIDGEWDNMNKARRSGATQYAAIAPSDNSAKVNTKKFLDNSGINVSDQIKNNRKLTPLDLLNNDMETPTELSIELSVEVIDSNSDVDLGMAIFALNPLQVSGYIGIYEGFKKKNEPDYTLKIIKASTHNMSLPVGNYVAQYLDTSEDTNSNIVNFNIGVKPSKEKMVNKNSYPIIEKVSHDSITVSNNDSRYSTLNVFETGGEFLSYDIGKDTFTVDNLKHDREYNIYLSNSFADRSDIVTVKTFEYENQEVDILNDFISSNNSLYISDEAMKSLNDVNMKNYNTLIDTVLDLPESKEKAELLIYSTILTNNLIDSFNESNVNHIKQKIQEHPFSNSISIDDYEKSIVFTNNNNKKSLSKILYSSEEEFYGLPQRHYSVYGVDENNKRSVKKDFIILKNNYLEYLESYLNTEKYKDLDLSYYNDKYKKFSSDTIKTIAIADNFLCDLDLLDPPYIYQKDNKLYADINYVNLKKDETYYLTYSEIHSALDFVPHRKLAFTINDETINLSKCYLGLIRTNRYLFWIEDSTFTKISKPYIFEYDLDIENKNELTEIYKTELGYTLTKLQAEFLNNYENHEYVKDIFNYIPDIVPSKKNIEFEIISEFIKYYNNSNYTRKTLYALQELFSLMHQKNKLDIKFDVIIDKENRNIKVSPPDGFYACAVRYTEDGVEKIINNNNIIYYGSEGYVLIYLMSNSMIYESGFVLIECSTNSYLYSYELFDNIKEGLI